MERLANAYGTRIHALLQQCHTITDLGTDFGAGLYQREVEFLLETEWAHSADDILWRRSKLGLYLNSNQVTVLEQFVRNRISKLHLQPLDADEDLRQAV